MEVKAYGEGFLRKWWLLGLIVVISFFIGQSIGKSQISQYTASTSILINSPLLATTAIPSNIVQISTPSEYISKVESPAILNRIIKAYPRLTLTQLKNTIAVSSDSSNELLLISVTDISPKSATNIANFLAQQFVKTLTADLYKQIDYYENWFRQNIPPLNAEIDRLNLEIQKLTPLPAGRSTPIIDPQTQRTIVSDQYQLDLDQRNFIKYEKALQDLQNSRPHFQRSYVILHPAIASNVPTSVPLSTFIINLIAVGIGLILAISLIIIMEYFHPCVRHKGELQRIAGFSVLAELPHIFNFERKRLLQLRPGNFSWHTKTLRFLSAIIGVTALKNKGHTVLLTSPRRKRRIAAIIATFLASNGLRTLLINIDGEKPNRHKQLNLTGPCNLVDSNGQLLPFISSTAHPHLFVLPVKSTLAQNEHLTSESLLDLLPELQNIFDLIIIDAPPLDRADTHLFATKVSETLLLVKKRRDSLKTLKRARIACQQLKLNASCLLLK